MKTLKYIIVLAIILGMSGCSDDFLEHKPLYSLSSETYYSTPDEINDALTGAYAVLGVGSGINQPQLMGIIRSPYFLGGADGAGIADIGAQSNDRFDFYLEDTYLEIWREYYAGIFRVNSIIANIDKPDYGENTDLKNLHFGQAYFLRGYYFYELAKFFGTVPLVTNPEPANLPKASPEELFAQIASDLKKAIEMLPATKYDAIPSSEYGRVTKWAAEAMMGRVWLFYTGTYNAADLPLVEGGSINKATAAAYVEDVINNSGHKLLDDFEQLWPYSTSMVDIEGFPYKQDGDFGDWIGWDGSVYSGYNPEKIFHIQYNTGGNHGTNWSVGKSNQISLYIGVRSNTTFPYGAGWGFAPVHPELWNQFEDGDPRQMGTVINLIDPAVAAQEGSISTDWDYQGGTGLDNTGYLLKKYMPIRTSSANTDIIWLNMGYQVSDNTQFSNLQDTYLMRYADVLLMAAELTENATYLNEVRARVGLDPVAYSLDAIKKERLAEFAGEGEYYFDLMRWGDLKATFDAMPSITIYSQGAPEDYKVNFMESRKFGAIPESQVVLSDGVLEQNEGWR